MHIVQHIANVFDMFDHFSDHAVAITFLKDFKLNYIYKIAHICYAECELDGVDVVLVLDDSISIKRQNWPFIINFTIDVATSLDIGLNNSLMGVILFGGNATIHFNTRQYLDQASLVEAISNIEYRRSNGTNTWLALDLLRESSQPNGKMMLREDFPAIAIVVTDGRSHNNITTKVAAQKLHDSKTFDQVYAVGIGSKIEKEELSSIASDPSLTFRLKKFEDFNELLHNLSQQFCDICKLITLLSTNDKDNNYYISTGWLNIIYYMYVYANVHTYVHTVYIG